MIKGNVDLPFNVPFTKLPFKPLSELKVRKKSPFPILKGVFAKNERGYRLTSNEILHRSLLILLLSVASIRRKSLKRLTPKSVASIQIHA